MSLAMQRCGAPAAAMRARRSPAAPRPAAPQLPRRSPLARVAAPAEADVAPAPAPTPVPAPANAAGEARAPRLDPAAAPEAQRPAFNWLKTWYPVAAEEHLDPAKPHAVKLMGQDIVLWRDAAGGWHAQQDLCPHRLAALSDGFVDAQAGQIVCSYHGWRFSSEGRCVDIPQLRGDETAHATACGSARTCIKTFPVKAKGGLLWVWPDSSPSAAADSEAAALPFPPELENEGVAPLEGRWFVREQPYSFDLFLENVLDPAHVDFAHDGVAGFSAVKHKPVSLQLLEDRGPAGFTYRIIPSKPGVRPSILNFAAPCHVSIIEEPAPLDSAAAAAGKADTAVRPGSSNPNIRSGLVFYVHPTRPGWSRFHGTSFIADRDGNPVKSFSIFGRSIPAWINHTLGHTFLAGDDFHLHAGSKNLARAGFDHTAAYYPVQQDQAVLSMRRWLSSYANGSPPWPAHMAGAAPILANLDLEKHQVLDRYHQHVRHCKHCLKALANTRRVAAAAGLVALAATFAAAAAAAAKLVTPAAAALPAAGGAAAAVAAAASVGAWPLLALAAAALGVRYLAKKLEGQFVGEQSFDRKPFPASTAATAAAAKNAAPAAASA